MSEIRIVTGIARRGDCILLVASRYANHPKSLWTLPGGRQEPGELATQTVEREVHEETGLAARVGMLAYASESYDSSTHIVNLTFEIETEGELLVPQSADHVVEAAWVSLANLSARIEVAVVREPLLAYLNGTLSRRYAGYKEAGITIHWIDETR
jgi:8-oxo-dGTP diphosphatase